MIEPSTPVVYVVYDPEEASYVQGLVAHLEAAGLTCGSGSIRELGVYPGLVSSVVTVVTLTNIYDWAMAKDMVAGAPVFGLALGDDSAPGNPPMQVAVRRVDMPPADLIERLRASKASVRPEPFGGSQNPEAALPSAPVAPAPAVRTGWWRRFRRG
jgi:hypothetical protein